MKFNEVIGKITPDVYRNLKLAVEIGKWPDGNKLTQDQLQNTLQAIIAYEQVHLPEEERTGYIDKGKKKGEHCDSPDSGAGDGDDSEQVIQLQKLKK